MTIAVSSNPFHSGEIEAQKRAGVRGLASQVAGFIRPYMPQQHREFFCSLPFLVLSAADENGRPWITILEGEEGFVGSPDNKNLRLSTSLDPQDPLANAFESGTDIGMLGIELETRRRNRLSGYFHKSTDGYAIDIRQSFGNCPQYISERRWHRESNVIPGSASKSNALSVNQIKRIQASDTMFIGSGQCDPEDAASNGYDASHRGGLPGFIQVIDETHLRIPDYAGNNFFNTIGNILKNPKVGLLFVEFESGSLLHVSGHAEIDWEPRDGHELGAYRMINVTIDAVVDRPAAISLRWESEGQPVRQMVVANKVVEAKDIASFYLKPADGRPLAPFKAGQHLPIELQLSEPYGKVSRSYSLSAAAHEDFYRLSIKREEKGLVSRIMHDVLQPGQVIEARAPAGEFTIPCQDCPVVLASAGIGITPLLAMLNELSAKNSSPPIWFVHGARNKATHAFRQEISALVGGHSNIKSRVFYSKPDQEDRQGVDYDHSGRVSADALLELNAGPDAHYMLCGPAAFVSNIQTGLETAGISPDHIHFETF
ncbi:MAG: pyridoxamine 5'-phosphate oxidase family protein [Rhizobiaceae bacterium]|nr:pyridoxamine 5'-phosphate oxidase family protein [Rhizobiaceae bacterium]